MERKHILLVTFPTYGLVIPMLEFGRKVSSFHDVTFAVSAEFIKQMRKRELIFATDTLVFHGMLDGYSTDMVTDPKDFVYYRKKLELVQPGIEKLLGSLSKKTAPRTAEGNVKQVDVVVADTYILAATKACIDKGIPVYQFEASAVASFARYLAIGGNDDWPIVPDDAGVVTLDTLEAGQAPHPVAKTIKDIFTQINTLTPFTRGVIINSVGELEDETVSVIKGHPQLLGIPLRTIGPLISDETISPFQKLQAQTIVSWLNRQPPASVAYVSFGSVAWPDAEQIRELCSGLLATCQPFIFSLQTKCHEYLPDAMKQRMGDATEKTEASFLVVDWAPQKLILSHVSTAVFISHCGWNSTLESVTNGVSIVGWPMFFEQKSNAQWVERKEFGCLVQGTGCIAARIVRSQEIKDVIEKVAKWKGNDSGYRRAAQRWKDTIVAAQRPGGSSFDNFMELMKFED